MARSLLVQNRRLVTAPGTRSIIAFDDVTGAGAECCCSPGTGGPCCSNTGYIACTTPTVTSPTTICGKRVDLALTGTLTHDYRFVPNVGAPIITYRNVVSSSLAVYWKLQDPTGNDPLCKTDIGYNSASTRNSVGQDSNGTWNLSRADTTFTTGLPTLSVGWNRVFDGTELLTPCQWSAFALGNGISQPPPGAAVALFDPAAIIKNGNETACFDASQGINASESAFPASVLGVECSGTRSKTLRPGFSNEQQFDLSWSSSSSATGGTLSLSYSRRDGRATQDHDLETWQMSGSWTMGISLCGSGSSATTPNSLLGL